jgi:hypothetical protein
MNDIIATTCEHINGEFLQCNGGESVYLCLDCKETYIQHEDTGCGG